MRTAVALLAAALVMPHLAVQAQDKPDFGIYKVEFNIREGSGPAANTGQRYTLRMEANRKATFKVGSRIPVATGSFQTGAGANPLVNTQFTYVDVGVNIECSVSEQNGKIAMHGVLDISSVLERDAAAHTPNPPNPTVGQTRLDLDTGVDLGKPTVIASIDDPAMTRHFVVEATVTRAN